MPSPFYEPIKKGIELIKDTKDTLPTIGGEKPPIDRWYDQINSLVHLFDDDGSPRAKQQLAELTELREDMHYYLKG